MPKAYSGSADVAIPVEELMQQYSELADEIVEAIASEALAEVEKHAQMAFRSQSGGLKKGIRKKPSKIYEGQVLVGAFAPHAHLIEYGHAQVDRAGRVVGHVAARPFLRPAEEAVEARLDEIIRRIIPDA